MIKDHKDKFALVTGSSRGLGKYLSIELAKNGFEIILVARTVGALEEQYDEINKLGSKSTIVPLDLSEDGSIDKLGFLSSLSILKSFINPSFFKISAILDLKLEDGNSTFL